MNETRAECLNCKRSSETVPLIRLEYAGKAHWICPQCLPILIHRPEQLPAVAGDWTKRGGAKDED